MFLFLLMLSLVLSKQIIMSKKTVVIDKPTRGRKKKAEGENIIRLNLYAKAKFGGALAEKYQPIIDKEVIKLEAKEVKQ